MRRDDAGTIDLTTIDGLGGVRVGAQEQADAELSSDLPA